MGQIDQWSRWESSDVCFEEQMLGTNYNVTGLYFSGAQRRRTLKVRRQISHPPQPRPLGKARRKNEFIDLSWQPVVLAERDDGNVVTALSETPCEFAIVCMTPCSGIKQ